MGTTQPASTNKLQASLEPYPALRRGMWLSFAISVNTFAYSVSSYLNLHELVPTITLSQVVWARTILSTIPVALAGLYALIAIRSGKADATRFRRWSFLHALSFQITCWAYYYPLALQGVRNATIRVQTAAMYIIILTNLAILPRRTELRWHILSFFFLFSVPQFYFAYISASFSETMIVVFDIVSMTAFSSYIAFKIAEHNEAQERIRENLLKESNEHYLAGVKFAHDVRSPIGALKVVLRQPNFTEDHRTLLATAIDRVENLSQSMNENFRKREKTQAQLRSHVEGIIKAMTAELSQRFEIPAEVLHVRSQGGRESIVQADPLELGRVFSNLLTNAWEAARKSKNPRIEVTITSDGVLVAVSIRNSGEPIPPSVLEQLGSRPVTYKIGGTGVGFWSAKKYLESINARLTIHSDKSIGTDVRAKIPCLALPEGEA